MDMKRALVYGAGGFIGSHMVKRLKKEGYWVMGVDLKYPEFSDTEADKFIIGDLRQSYIVNNTMYDMDEVYQFAAEMGGAGFVFTGEHDADIMYNSVMINLNTANVAKSRKVMPKVFFSSSACMYPAHNQLDVNNPDLSEDSAYPANPDSDYGWEKLFSERLYLAYQRNYGLDVRIARYHNIFGVEGTWQGGREKSPAAICRKVAEAPHGGKIEIWGDGKQTRSFLYINECVEATWRLMQSPQSFPPVNIGSEEMISINDLAKMVIFIANKNLSIVNLPDVKALGVRGRRSDNRFIEQCLGWKPDYPLLKGMELTYHWINKQVKQQNDA